jgi:asparagine synthase (glutamine-hydrolysing)
MCGITGFFDLEAARTGGLAPIVERMCDTLIHRGPDDRGVWVDAETGIGLGHRRLSIVDLSPQGHQPMHSACGRYVIAFNGEIYNFRDLRAELEQIGAAPAWRGHSDTEVMLAAIAHWGLEDAVRRMAGMFAFALWDRAERVLHLVRDRLGEKPLYYGWLGRRFLFGSELKALRAHPEWQAAVDRDALTLFLRHGYIPCPHTIHRGIYKLEPGACLSLTAEALFPGRDFSPFPEAGTRLRPRRYWSARQAIGDGVENPLRLDDTDAVSRLDELLRRSVAGQMVADVPLGAFLSGGIDSSTVVALMQAQSLRPVKTFTIGFREQDFNEAEYAKAVARHLGTEHTELYVSPDEARAVIPQLPALYDEPFGDSSQIPTFLVSRLARRHVTVSLSGDGGDELFAGYGRYAQAVALWNRIERLPFALRRRVAGMLRLLSPRQWDACLGLPARMLPSRYRQRLRGEWLHRLADNTGTASAANLYLDLIGQWKNPAALVLGATEPASAITGSWAWAGLPTLTEAMTAVDLASYLPDDILAKVDRAAMGVSLETRIPLLDHRVVEFAWRLPPSLKVRDGQGKWILRQVLKRYVPEALFERRKMGFGVPIDSWLRGPLRAWGDALLDEERLRREGYFNPEPIRGAWREHLSGTHDRHYYLWNVLMFQAWLEAQT